MKFDDDIIFKFEFNIKFLGLLLIVLMLDSEFFKAGNFLLLMEHEGMATLTNLTRLGKLSLHESPV